MSDSRKIKVSEFLAERKERFKPAEAISLGLKRIEKIDFKGNIYLNPEIKTKTNMILVKTGDLVVSGINVEKGAISVYKGEEDVLATIHYSSYQYDEEKINIDYLKYFVSSSEFRKIIEEQTKGGIKTEIKAKQLLSLEIDLPTLEVQQIIVDKIKEVENEVEQLEKINEQNVKLTKSLKDSLLLQAIQGELTLQNTDDEPARVLIEKIIEEKRRLIKEKKIKKEKPYPEITEEEKSFPLPDGWEWVRLGDISEKITDGTHQTPNYTESGAMFLSAQNVKPFRFMPENHKFVSVKDYEAYTKNTKPELNDVLLTRVGSNIGESAIIDQDLDFAIYVSLGLIKPFKEFINSDYLCLWLNSPDGTQKSLENVLGRGTSQGNLNLTLIRNFVVPLPPLEEQKRIVKRVKELLATFDELLTQVIDIKVDSENIMKTILKEAFSKKEEVLV
jgi:type I restriction enzyme, S subunit